MQWQYCYISRDFVFGTPKRHNHAHLTHRSWIGAGVLAIDRMKNQKLRKQNEGNANSWYMFKCRINNKINALTKYITRRNYKKDCSKYFFEFIFERPGYRLYFLFRLVNHSKVCRPIAFIFNNPLSNFRFNNRWKSFFVLCYMTVN